MEGNGYHCSSNACRTSTLERECESLPVFRTSRAWLRLLDGCRRLADALPPPLPLSNTKRLPLEKALAFMHGWLGDARKLTHLAYLRRDPLVPELLGIKHVASQSVLTRFFQRFTSAGAHLRCFRPFWRSGNNSS